MSEIDHSPPKTPRRPIMAIVNEKLAEKSAARGTTPTPGLTPASSSKLPQKIRGVGQRLLPISIQIPATPQSSSPSPSKESHVLQHHDHTDDVSQDVDMDPHAEPESGPDETVVSLDSLEPKRGDLGPFNWEGFEQCYEMAIKEMSDKEDHLIEDFQNLSEAFTIWAESSSEQDNERACKRLKTRERYVQIQEMSLNAKKQHYTKVVEAFKQALQLFGE
ncbi:hypothetical protein SBOR_1516 [Sclerotinia borealis F-4128]|uniref:Uncharacterized protein n=1 Tax=Sclerotinia borealis (strain F-4128) TaxID=1432307 RepID=W9CMV5_SCLBF|nr:hypothetical protein SBOR_1516 [Sclerotinia borealis F-4128]